MDKKMMALLLVFFLMFVIFVSSVIFNEPLRRFTRASEQYTTVSLDKSKILYWPQIVKADGISSSLMQIFLVSSNNTPLLNKRVRVTTTLGQVKEGEQTAAKEGHTYYLFTISSEEVGEAVVSVFVDGTTQLKQQPKIQFTQ